jgi:hypothetical protein
MTPMRLSLSLSIQKEFASKRAPAQPKIEKRQLRLPHSRNPHYFLEHMLTGSYWLVKDFSIVGRFPDDPTYREFATTLRAVGIDLARNGGFPDPCLLIEHLIRDPVKDDCAVICPFQVEDFVLTLLSDYARR